MTDTTLRGQLHHVDVGPTSFGYHQFGTGEPLVLLCGNAMCMSMWTDALLGALGREFAITIFDYHGMGQSTSPPDTSWDIPDMAGLKLDLLNALELDRPHLLGWSTGGEIALQMAAINGDRLGKIVSVAGDPGSSQFVGDPNVMDMVTQADEEESLRLIFPDDQAEALNNFLNDYLSRPQDEPTVEVLQLQTASWERFLASGIYDQLPSITNPTLLMNGLVDKLISPVNAVNMATRIPGAWLIQIANAGHGVLLQEPEFCSRIITEFLKNG